MNIMAYAYNLYIRVAVTHGKLVLHSEQHDAHWQARNLAKPG